MILMDPDRCTVMEGQVNDQRIVKGTLTQEDHKGGSFNLREVQGFRPGDGDSAPEARVVPPRAGCAGRFDSKVRSVSCRLGACPRMRIRAFDPESRISLVSRDF